MRTVELRGIISEPVSNGRKIRLVTRGQRGDDYETLVFPSGKPFNKGQIIKFLGSHYNLPPGEIKWAAHVKIPEEK